MIAWRHVCVLHSVRSVGGPKLAANATHGVQDTHMTPRDHRQVVAIDGPGAAGKSTVARVLADRIDAMVFDTGALYRAVTLAATQRDVAGSDSAGLTRLARGLDIEIRPASLDDGRQVDVLLGGDDVTWAIRAPEVDARVSE